MKRLFLALSLALAVMSASAIPAKRGTWKTLKLADGSEVRAELRGDEFGHYWQTEDGRRFIINAETGTAEAADVKAMKANAAEKRKQASQRRLKRAPRAKASTRADNPVYEGEKKGLIILVQFDDVKFKAENTPEQFRRIANEEGFAEGNFTGSVKDYFKAQSYGRFTIDFDVAGPVTMPNGYAYYGENGIFGTDKTGRIGEMIEQACRGVEGQVDFNDYDWDGDGEADQVYVLYAGHGEADTEDPNTIWPHEYELRYALGVCPMVGGVYINTYACGPELGVGDYTAGIGTICHEFSHCLGFPDMYDTDDNVNYGTGYWDVMCMGNYNNDSFTPASYTSLERWYAGWIEPTVLDTDTKIENLGALETTGEAYVLYNERDDDEYYLIENRQHEGWDAGLPGAGMLILHVDFDERAWQNNTFNNNTPQHCTIFPADNSLGYKTDDLAGDVYPYNGNNCLTNTSLPAATLNNKNTDGSRLMNKFITDITQNDDGTMAFTFSNLSKATEDYNLPQSYIFYESFDLCNGSGGNDGSFNGSEAGSGSLATDNDGWAFTEGQGASQCAMLGSATTGGEAVTPAIKIDGECEVWFKVAPYATDSPKLTVEANGGNASLSRTEFMMREGRWTVFNTTLTGDGDVRLTFNNGGQRFFLDKVCLTTDNVDTGINNATTGMQNAAPEGIYSIDGRRLGTDFDALPKGIYIVNGKKIVK